MPTSAKDRSAAGVLRRWLDFKNALSGKSMYLYRVTFSGKRSG